MVEGSSLDKEMTYSEAGVDVDAAGRGLAKLVGWTGETLEFRQGLGESKLDYGYFANVIDVGNGTGLAISTDGVGTKLLIAQEMGKFDTVGIDCVAMNANDILCVGAEPLTMVDTISLEDPKEDLLDALGKGLYEGCRQANISLVGGELAQVAEMVRGPKPGYAFDLVGTCVGTVPLDSMIVGADIAEGDVVVGLRSSGVHSNGFTLARRVLLETGEFRLDQHVAQIGRTVGEELLEPTKIYVKPVVEMIQRELPIHAMIHLTGDGYLNLNRVAADVGYVLDGLPAPQPVFDLIQDAGRVTDAEMYRSFNMGIGFCVIVEPDAASTVEEIAEAHGFEAQAIGHAVEDPERRIRIPDAGLVSKGKEFVRE